MSIAHNYANCFWNASGEYDCGTEQVPDHNQTEYHGQTEYQSQTTCQISNLPKSYNMNTMSPDFAQFPQTGGQNQSYRDSSSGHQRLVANNQRMNGSSQDLCPLQREMEISVYLPERDQEFPWQRQPSNHSSPPPQAFNETSDHSQVLQRPHQQAQPPPPPKPTLQWSQQSKYLIKVNQKHGQYYFQLPYKKYFELVEEFGLPNLVNQQPGGIAVWQRKSFKNTPYHFIKRIDLIDEQCFNSFPLPHIGFLYTYVKINIPVNKIASVISLYGDSMYDPMKHILIIRGMSLNYNLAILSIICLYVNGQLTYYNIKEGDLIRKAVNHKQLTNPKVQEKNLQTLSKYLTSTKSVRHK